LSCIAGCFSPGGPATPEPVGQMLATMHARAPDGDQIFHEGPVALGQAHLRTGSSGAEGVNALTLDRQVWLVADARIDDRPRLLRSLRSSGRVVADDAPHGELVLHAYAAFGIRLVDHLVGDFAFAIWDAPRQQLLCVRDHLGVRPFYYARLGERFYFASDIAALLAITGVPRDLDQRAVGEFLLLGMSLEPQRTIFSAIRSVPPASMMLLSRDSMEVREWWTLKRGAEQRYPRREDYVERFREVFGQAVEDRLPGGPVALQLSGGMDSTSIAAVAVQAARTSGHAVTAYHLTTESLIPEDDERAYAQQAADRLGIGMVSQDLGRTPLFASHRGSALHTSQPMPAPHLAVHAETLELIARSGARVWLSGYMGDAALSGQAAYFPNLLRGRRWGKFASEMFHHWRLGRSVRGLGMRALFGSGASSPDWKPPMPDWIDPEFIRAHRLDESWHRFWQAHESATDGLEQLRHAWLGQQYRATEILSTPLVARYPFLDLRLIEFLSGLPNCLLYDKRILRDAMQSRLPAAILARPKMGAAGDIVRTMVTNGILDAQTWSARLPPAVLPAAFAGAVDRYRQGQGKDSTWSSWLVVQTIALGHWLANNGIERKDVSDE
jgi:asparagine synthase (glutamine-hydrolysing)